MTIQSPPSDVQAPSRSPVAAVTGLVKRYGHHEAVGGLDLEVYPGEIFGFLGPNGAGKTTTLEILVGLRQATAGTVTVMGMNPVTQRDRLRDMVAVQPQQAELFPTLTAKETLELWASFYSHPHSPAAVLADVGLQEAAGTRVHQLSGGQQRRLLVATALISAPRLVILDEPSTGLDPNAQAELWEVLVNFRDEGGTVLLSTHAMEEAEAVCDRVAIIDGGHVAASGTPGELITTHASQHVVSFQRDGSQDLDALRGLPDVGGVEVHGNRVQVHTSAPESVSARVLAGPPPAQDLTIRNAGLGTVFRELTGHAFTYDEK